ncbi:hypothetical protein VNI00_016900 [Paramarasmius palmivorus]|uniref:CxC2-like cysteine cluster KDZ transposase-associated domain-containing protein n=1 Tax=Paramarasmius palmivorus TaxID=297713 RepID=A0AAW0BAY9_9AGAR
MNNLGGRKRQRLGRNPPGFSRTRVTSGYEDDYNVVKTRELDIDVRGRQRVTYESTESGSKGWDRAKEWVVEDRDDFALDPTGEWYDEVVSNSIFEEGMQAKGEADQTKKRKKPKSEQARRPNIYWKTNYRSSFLRELLRAKGRGDARGQMACSECNETPQDDTKGEEGMLRCQECFLGDLLCRSCCVRRHEVLPFHVVERWNGEFFEVVSLKSLGLVVQLNHQSLRCVRPTDCHVQMRVLHTNGIHDVAIKFCGCNNQIPHYQQLLRRGLYPATVREHRIKTCATFQLLEALTLQSLTTKSGTYDFYRALERMSDAAGLNEIESRYKSLRMMIRQWKHLKLVIRSGYAHDPEPVTDEKLPEGCLTMKCPSCPHIGINLPDSWEDAASARKFLHMLCLCLDANFRLKSQLVSSHSRDPALSGNAGYMIGLMPYKEWTSEKGDADEISSCVSFNAIAKQNTKFSKGLRYTGVGGACCGRTDMVLAIANLTKGERYSVMDAVFCRAIKPFLGLLWFLRMQKWPGNEDTKIDQKHTTVIPAIGKLHEPGHHQDKQHKQFSLNLVRGAGHVDGEGMERIWGIHNALSNCTKTMGPGARQDTLESAFDFWNFLKYIAMGATLRTRYRDAVGERNKQRVAHDGLSDNLPAELVEKWTQMVDEWEQASYPKKQAANPFAVEGEFLSQREALTELDVEEEERVRRGGVRFHETGPAGLVVLALDIQDTQAKILEEMTRKDRTFTQTRKLTERRNALHKRIVAYEKLRSIYMPGLYQYLEETNQSHTPEDSMPELTKLWLPSDLPPDKVNKVALPELRAAEAKLQLARCYDALDGLRHTLRVKSRMMLFKNKNVRGQRDSGKSREVINRVVARAKTFVAKYRRARLAYHALAGPGDWEKTIRVLHNSDVRSMRDPALVKVGKGRQGTNEEEECAEAEVEPIAPSSPAQEGELDLIHPDRTEWEHRTVHGTGDTRKEISWIWTVQWRIQLEDGADENDNECLRAEWCKSLARVKRASEEVELVKEEMNRTAMFLDWRAREWEATIDKVSSVQGSLKEGMVAYAKKQAWIQRELRHSFIEKWKLPLSKQEPQDKMAGQKTGREAEAEASDVEQDDEEETIMADLARFWVEGDDGEGDDGVEDESEWEDE